MGNVTIPFVGDASQIIREYEKLIEKQSQQIIGLQDMKAASKESGKELQQLANQAKRLYEQAQTPQQRHREQIELIGRAYTKGKLTQEQYTQTMAKLKAEYNAMSPAAQRLAEETKKSEEEAKRLRETALKMYRDARPPQQKYTEEMHLLTRAFKKGELSADQYKIAVDGVTKKYKNAEDKGMAAFGPAVLGNIKKVAVALGIGGGLTTVVKVLISHYQQLQQTHLDAFNMRRELATSEELTNANLGAVRPSEREDLKKGIAKLSKDLDIEEASIHRRFQTAISSRSGKTSLDDVLGSVRESYGLFRYNDQAGASAAGLAVSLIPEGYSPKEGVGLFAATQPKSKVADAAQFGKSFPKALTRAHQAGLSDREAGALFSAVSTSMADEGGMETATAMRGFFDALKKHKLSDEFGAESTPIPGKTEREKMLWLLQHKKEAAEFADTAPLGAGSTTWRDFFAGGTAFQNYQQYTKEIPKRELLGKYADAVAKGKENTPNMRAARTDDFIKQAQERMLKAISVQQAETAKYIDEFENVATKAGIPAYSQWLGKKDLMLDDMVLGKDPKNVANMYRTWVRQLLANRAYGPQAEYKPGVGWESPMPHLAAATATEREQARQQIIEVDKIIQALDMLHLDMEYNNRLLERQEEEAKKGNLEVRRLIRAPDPIRNNSDKD